MPERADEYPTRLTDSTFKSQRPDGGEIVDALNSVVGTVTVGGWYMQIIGGGSILDADQQQFNFNNFVCRFWLIDEQIKSG